jgi:WD repeat-containing protein 24
MNVFLALTLKNKVNLTDIPIEEYTEAYIDLLHRYQLYSQATRLMHISSIKSIRDMNGENSTFYASCYNCATPVSVGLSTRVMCAKCDTVMIKCSYWYCAV